MGFFKQSEKELAAKTPREALKREYERTERNLERATYTGDIREVKKAMKEHQKYEYALLTQTYERARKRKQRRKK
mgnify:FL=1